MLFSCTHCGTRYQLPDEQVANRVLKVRCTQCSAVLIVRDPAAPPEPKQAEAPAWFVAVGGEQRGPLSLDEVRALVRVGDFGPRSYAWTAGLAQWTRAEEIAVLQALFDVPPALPTAPPPLPVVEEAIEAARREAATAELARRRAEAARIKAAAEAAEAARAKAAAEAAEAAGAQAQAEAAEAARAKAAAEAAEAARAKAAAEAAEAARAKAAAEAAESERAKAAAEAAEAARAKAAAEAAESERAKAAAEAAEAARAKAAAEAAESERAKAAAEAAESERVKAAAEAAEAAQAKAAAEAARAKAAAEAAESERVKAAAEAAESERVKAAAEAAESERVKAAAEAAESERVKAEAEAALTRELALAARVSSDVPPIVIAPTLALVPEAEAPRPPLPTAPVLSTESLHDHEEAFFEAAPTDRVGGRDLFAGAGNGVAALATTPIPQTTGRELSFVGRLDTVKKRRAPTFIVLGIVLAAAAAIIAVVATSAPGPVATTSDAHKARGPTRIVHAKPAKVVPAPETAQVAVVPDVVDAPRTPEVVAVDVKPSGNKVDREPATKVAQATGEPTSKYKAMSNAEYAAMMEDSGGKSEVKIDYDANAAARQAEAEAAEKKKATADELAASVVEALGKKKSQFAKCSDDTQERVHVQFTVLPSGAVSGTQIEGTASATKTRCLADIMGRSIFPAGVDAATYRHTIVL